MSAVCRRLNGGNTIVFSSPVARARRSVPKGGFFAGADDRETRTHLNTARRRRAVRHRLDGDDTIRLREAETAVESHYPHQRKKSTPQGCSFFVSESAMDAVQVFTVHSQGFNKVLLEILHKS